MSFYRTRSAKHERELGIKRKPAPAPAKHENDEGDGDDTGEVSMQEFAAREREARLPQVRAADKRVQKFRKAVSRG